MNSLKNMSSIEIRPAMLCDLAAVFALEQQVFETAVYPDFFFRQAYDSWPDFFILAWQGNHLLGYLLAAPGQEGLRRVGILSLAVLKSSRGLGVGKSLLQYLLDHACIATREFWLTVAPDNLPALQLYEKSGFIRQKYTEDYYGEGEARWVLVKQQGDEL
jgi:ribosomal-protein-alanine N-acetyltransferase